MQNHTLSIPPAVDTNSGDSLAAPAAAQQGETSTRRIALRWMLRVLQHQYAKAYNDPKTPFSEVCALGVRVRSLATLYKQSRAEVGGGAEQRASGAAAAAVCASAQSIPLGNHGDNLRSAQK